VNLRLAIRRGVLAALLVVAFVLQGTGSVLAGTTGSLSGSVMDPSTHAPIAGAVVTATSPSQSSTTTTDSAGKFTFISLAPDTYTVSVAATSTRDGASISGLTIQADQLVTVTLSPPPKLKQIGSVTSRSAAALVKPGTTADVYSVNATLQDKASAVGGGGTLNSAWSAISTVPGVYVAPGQNGYIGAGASLSIRGGDYDQVGYEFDGVPVNRSFDNYPSGTLSSLGQQELQVYTGANPANAEANGLSGYINQVIRTGTAPGSNNFTLAAGTPTYYNKLAFESGWANPSRTFSYYLGLGGYNQDYRYFDQYNGSGIAQQYGTALYPCNFVVVESAVRSCTVHGQDLTYGGTQDAWALGPAYIDGTHENKVRDTVLNFHFGIPKKDGTKDDIQALLDIDHLSPTAYTSVNDLGGPAFVSNLFGGTPFYLDAYQYLGQIGTPLDPATAGSRVVPYLYPQSPTGRAFDAPLPYGMEGQQANDQNIFKLQYQHNFGTNAFLRIYGYTYYSDWMMTDPTSAFGAYYIGTYAAFSPDYELSSHTRGVSLQFSDQLNSQHLLTLQGNYVTANSVRDNNTEFVNGFYGPNSVNARTAVGVAVNAANPTYGCFTPAGTLTYCNNYSGADYITLQQLASGMTAAGPIALPASCPVPGTASAACEFLTVGNGEYATYNTVVPKFSAFSITDDWKPTDKLTVNLGARFDQFQFVTSSLNDNAARQLYYNSFNSFACFAPNSPVVTYHAAGASCAAGTYAAHVSNADGGTATYPVWQPRFGLTYSVDPTTVVRASYGRYTQAPNSAFEQYDALQANAPYLLYNTYGFQEFGFTSSLHNVGPEVSNNFDFSIEKSFSNDLSMKITPFLRKTQDQIQQFYLSFVTSFVSGLNVGNQTSQGVEFELDKGDFSRNGIAARLSFTYTNSFIHYTGLPGGGTVLDPLNTSIKGYNAYTSFCASNPSDPRCAGASTQSGVAAPCYGTGAAAGTAVAPVGGTCPTGSIANPYWNDPVQNLLNASQNLATYDILPGPAGTNGNAYGAPYVSTLIVQYKHGPLAITPALQFVGGQKYGTPLTTNGVAPDLCTAALPGTTRYDIASCPDGASYFGVFPGYNISIPNTYTGGFDSLGSFTEPNILMLHAQVSYDVNKRLTLVGTFANLYVSCFGGSKVPWAIAGACGYSPNNLIPIGNNYNPGTAIQAITKYPYNPYFNSTPFNAYIEARIKL